jgi:hypothetical protein
VPSLLHIFELNLTNHNLDLLINRYGLAAVLRCLDRSLNLSTAHVSLFAGRLLVGRRDAQKTTAPPKIVSSSSSCPRGDRKRLPFSHQSWRCALVHPDMYLSYTSSGSLRPSLILARTDIILRSSFSLFLTGSRQSLKNRSYKIEIGAYNLICSDLSLKLVSVR